MAYWLLKSEPDVFGIDTLRARGESFWDGVRNYQARNFLRAMQPGDLAFFYHSSCAEPAIVGVMRISAGAQVDPTQFDPVSPYHDPKSDPARPRWDGVTVRYLRHLPAPLPLGRLRADPALAEFALVQKGSRLSVMPVSPAQWRHLCALAGIAVPE